MKACFALVISCFWSAAIGAAGLPARPSQASMLLAEAEQAIAVGERARAIEIYQALVEQDRNQPLPWLRLAALYRERNELEQSVAAAGEVLRIYPDESVAPDAAAMISAARLERARAHALLAIADLQAVRDPALEPARAELSESLRTAQQLLSEDDEEAEFRRAVKRTKSRSAPRGSVIVVTHAGASALARPASSQAPVIHGTAQAEP